MIDPLNLTVSIPNHPKAPNIVRTAQLMDVSFAMRDSKIEIKVLIQHMALVNGVLESCPEVIRDRYDSIFVLNTRQVDDTGTLVSMDAAGNYPAGVTLHNQFDFWIAYLQNAVKIFELIKARIIQAGADGALEV
jgi:hypothetical protein